MTSNIIDSEILLEEAEATEPAGSRIKTLRRTYVAALESENRALREALKLLHDDCIDYSRINNLGGENNHVLVNARLALRRKLPALIAIHSII